MSRRQAHATSAEAAARLGAVDLAMFLFYLVLWALGVAAAVGAPPRFAPLVASSLCAVAWFVARRQLGESFTVRPEAHGLVMTGLYSRIRHPIYLFGTSAFLLVLLAIKGWSALALWVVLIPVQVLRAVREERVLRTAFGADYEAYRRVTWF
ncbi:methyltransferase family protein [Phycicoccus sonneratiae]|uniref:Isoprenylcysteine carboxylmethyltransferase family protein n=1 Tax=Phycicoccus sonneratiae TaxID=2807628 RepID=A0ABS2CIP1_9MICO|nr:isoprenylcysteine carboxylmethyltransferase family protein [Phycicoccus sonneraticus]MBM6399757.1 isoprenylcysteine carboxylmethyltransferase family protein [Phycicoccus sonneraticus]